MFFTKAIFQTFSNYLNLSFKEIEIVFNFMPENIMSLTSLISLELHITVSQNNFVRVTHSFKSRFLKGSEKKDFTETVKKVTTGDKIPAN